MDFNFDTGAIYDGLQILDVTTIPPLGGTAGVLTILGTGAITLPQGTTAQEPGIPVAGMFRYNSDITALEFYNNTTWVTLSSTAGSVSSFQTSLSGLTPSTATTGAVTLSGTLGAASGGTGQTSITTNGVVFGNGTSAAGVTAAGTQYQVLNAGAAGVPTFDAVHLDQSAAVNGNLPLTHGGTNASLTAANGGVVYSTASTLAISAAGTLGQVLTSAGSGAPTWTNASSTLTTDQILRGDGTGAFTADGATFVGSGSFSGVTLSGTVTNSTDATTKAYVDGTTGGLSWKQAVRAATTTNGILATAFSAGQVIDGYTLVLGDRILIKNQTTQTENGIYIVTAGTPTRSPDANTTAELDSAAVFVEGGGQAATSWVQITLDPVIGTNNIVFVQFSGQGTYAAGTALTLSGNTFNVRTDGVTMYTDGSNNLAVDSSNTSGQVLVSAGTAGTTASWGSVALGNTSAVSGILASTNGGTGTSTAPTTGQVLIGTSSNVYTPATLTSGTAINIVSTSGSITVNNTGVTSAVAGTGISVSSATGAVTIGNTGVLSITGTANQITTSASSGAITLSVPSTFIAPGSVEITTSLTVDSLTANSFLYSGTAGLLTTTSAPTNGQLLIGSTGATPVKSTLTAGTGISITNGAGSITVNNAGVTSVALLDGSTSPIYTISGSPVTTTGTLTFTLASQTANTAFLAPNGSSGQPGFRAIAYADLPIKLYAENPSAQVAPVASGTNAVAIGSGAVASATASFAEGDGTNASIWGGKVFANGSFATEGDAQHGIYILRNITIDATPTSLFLDGATGTQRLIVGNNSVWTFDILVTARRTDAVGGGAGYRFVGVIRKDGTAGSTTFVGTPSKTVLGETDAAWDVTLSADTTNGDLHLSVQGQSAKTIRWVATVQTTEVTN